MFKIQLSRVTLIRTFVGSYKAKMTSLIGQGKVRLHLLEAQDQVEITLQEKVFIIYNDNRSNYVARET